MAWTEVKDAVIMGGGFARIIPLTSALGVITAAGTPINLTEVAEESDDFALPLDAKVEYMKKDLSTNVSVQILKSPIMIDGASGYQTTADGGSPSTINVKAVVSSAQKAALIAAMTDFVVISIAIGRKVDGTIVGYEHLLGKMGSSVKGTRKYDMEELDIQVKGAATTASLAYNTLSALITAAIIPVGLASVTMTAPADFPTLLTGAICRTGLT
jgi:hypothetical protein